MKLCVYWAFSKVIAQMQGEKVNYTETKMPYQHLIPPLTKVAELDIQLGTNGIWSFLSFLLGVCIFVSFVSPKVNINTRKWFNSFN